MSHYTTRLDREITADRLEQARGFACGMPLPCIIFGGSARSARSDTDSGCSGTGWRLSPSAVDAAGGAYGDGTYGDHGLTQDNDDDHVVTRHNSSIWGSGPR